MVTADPLIITVAPLGGELRPEQTPHLHYRPAEFAAMARRCAELGASILHIHCRDDRGENTHDIERFAEVRREVRAQCDLIVQFSTGGAVGMSLAERAAPLALRPEMASLTCGSINFGEEIFANPWPFICLLARQMMHFRVVPELEIFDLGHVGTAQRLVKEGLIPQSPHVNIILGVPGALQASAENLVSVVRALPESWSWSVGAIGRAQLPMAVMAIAMGGHVRVGLEDNLYYRKGVLARNEDLVARIARISEEMQRPLATPEEARHRLGIVNTQEGTW